jgi:hypothetical protein
MTIKNPLFTLALGAILLGTACETDFQLEGDWKDIPIVYAYLSSQDTAYYVRVERAFLEPGGNAVEIAQIPDSIYYAENDVVVKLERLSNGETATLQRVDGRDEGYPRESGDFASEPNYLYKLKTSEFNLPQGADFRLIIEREGEDPATATTTMLREVEVSRLPAADFFEFGDFSQQANFGFRASGEAARVFDIRLIFSYRETDPDNPSEYLDKQATWVLANDILRDESVSSQSISVPKEAFYNFLVSEIEPLTTGNRRFDKINIEVAAAGAEIESYLRIADANIGITSAQTVPVYTNVENGRGIVSSRYFATSGDFGLSGRSRDSLYNGRVTRDLRFVP